MIRNIINNYIILCAVIAFTRRVRVVVGLFHYVSDGLCESGFSAVRVAQTDAGFQRRGGPLYARLQCTACTTTTKTHSFRSSIT